MSDNKNLSIDEIIKKAEQIKAEAERQLRDAEKKLDNKAKAALDEVVVDETAVAKRIAKAAEKLEGDEDVKQYVPGGEDVKTFTVKGAQKIEEPEEEKPLPADGKTINVNIIGNEGHSVPLDDFGKTRQAPLLDEKTKRVSFVSTKPETVDEDSDLKKAPTIVAKEQLYEGFGEVQESEYEEEVGEQITFDGFDDKIEDVPSIDEALAEKELEKRRSEKVGKFRLFGPEETDSALGDTSVINDDYESKTERSSFVESLYSRRSAIQTKLIATAVLGIPLLLLTVLKDSTYFPAFLSSHTAYFICALVLYAAVIIANFNVIAHGFNMKRGLNADFFTSLTSILIFAHTVLLLSSSSIWIDNGVLLASAGTFALFMSQYAKFKMMSRIVDNFEFISDGNDKYTIENITNAVDSGIIARGLIDEEPRLKMSVKTDFPTNFLEISCKNEPADKITHRIYLAVFLLNAALFVAVGILDNFNTALNVALCGLAISLPLSALYLTNSVLSDISSQLIDYSSCVCGYEGAAMAENANAMVMEAADLFGKESCDLHGIKTFGGAKVDDAIIHAAAIIVQTKSPLKHVFDEVIIGQQSILPKVEGIQYEEKLGTSAWIYKRKVLVGTRELMRSHGIPVPKQSFEDKYTIKNRKALYLAIDGNLVAMFIVSYSADPDLRHELRKLEKSGITIIVKSADPYINEESITDLFGIPGGFIRVMNYSAARAYDKYSGLNVEKSPAYVVHNGSALGFISAMRGASVINGLRSVIGFLSAFGSILGFAVVALLSILGAYSQLSALSIIIFQAVWTGFMALAVKFRCLSM